MDIEVYANGLEIACRAAGTEGRSVAAFPDPCWSAPASQPGPRAVPYPNTAYAGDLANGTQTVFIAGQEVAIEDVSYLRPSTGNEAATAAFGGGVKSGVIEGRAQFRSWSFDVAFEGFGVPRHTDLMTHNHGASAANTPPTYYLDARHVAERAAPAPGEEDLPSLP